MGPRYGVCYCRRGSSTITHPISDLTQTGYNVSWLENFQGYKRAPFRFLGYLELIQNHSKPKVFPFEFFLGIVRPYFFQINRTAVLLSILYHTLFKISSALCVFFRNFHLVKGYPPAFKVNFGLRKR